MRALLWYFGAISWLWSVNAEQCTPNPCKNGGQCIPDPKNSTAYTCKCAIHFEGKTCENDMDMCRTNPCQNDGSCTNSINNYTCHCAEGFSGKNCETDNDTCRSSPCLNGGSCTNDINSYTCTCTNDFSGKSCEIDNDTCRSNPCLHGGNCTNGANKYTCKCPQDYSGQNCGIDIDLCRSHPCKNHGTCQNAPNTYTCTCPDGFNGTNCEIDNEMCKSKPCKNNATCQNLPNNYVCHCAKYFTGTNCSIDTDMCRTNPCEQGGKCTNVPSTGSFTCDCPAWAPGKTCQDSVCASGYMDTNCEITNASVLSQVFEVIPISASANSPATRLYRYIGNRSVTFNLNYDFGMSKVLVQVNGTITLHSGSLLTATSFDFNTTALIHLADMSSLSTTALGFLSATGAWGNKHDGASHIGVGGASQGGDCFLQANQNWKLPDKFSHKNTKIPPTNRCGDGTVDARGGGTIALTAYAIHLQGRLLAEGGPAVGEGGGGAGGSIDIAVNQSVSCIFKFPYFNIATFFNWPLVLCEVTTTAPSLHPSRAAHYRSELHHERGGRCGRISWK